MGRSRLKLECELADRNDNWSENQDHQGTQTARIVAVE